MFKSSFWRAASASRRLQRKESEKSIANYWYASLKLEFNYYSDGCQWNMLGSVNETFYASFIEYYAYFELFQIWSEFILRRTRAGSPSLRRPAWEARVRAQALKADGRRLGRSFFLLSHTKVGGVDCPLWTGTHLQFQPSQSELDYLAGTESQS